MNAPRLILREPFLPPKSGSALEVIRRWRALSGGSRVRDSNRRTLIACSAGADSSCLALCLAAATSNLVIAHILHDLRPEPESRADLEAARSLASSLSLPFVSAAVACRHHAGNQEAIARRERYDALVALARSHACPFIATAHHADDQLETLLMRFIRGAGPRGLSGIAPKRRLAPGITLVRPMLTITRADAEAICTAAGVPWVIDATNADRTRLRAALRHNVIPAIRAVAPGITTTAGRIAAVQREVARELERAAASLVPQAIARPSAPGGSDQGELRLSRASLSAAPRAVAELALRRTIARAGRAPDAISTRTLKQLLAAIRCDSGEVKNFEFPSATLRLDASSLVIRPRT